MLYYIARHRPIKCWCRAASQNTPHNRSSLMFNLEKSDFSLFINLSTVIREETIMDLFVFFFNLAFVFGLLYTLFSP